MIILQSTKYQCEKLNIQRFQKGDGQAIEIWSHRVHIKYVSSSSIDRRYHGNQIRKKGIHTPHSSGPQVPPPRARDMVVPAHQIYWNKRYKGSVQLCKIRNKSLLCIEDQSTQQS